MSDFALHGFATVGTDLSLAIALHGMIETGAASSPPPPAPGGASAFTGTVDQNVYQIVAGDTTPPLLITCLQDRGSGAAAVNFPNGTTAVLHAIDPTTGLEVTLALEAVDLTLGQWQHVWSAGETDHVGIWRGQVHVTYPDLTVGTFPSDSTRVRWRVNAYV